MSEMESKLKECYEEVGIASVEHVKDENGYFDYEEMFRSFRCPKKDDCREACRAASGNDSNFLFSPRTDDPTVSQCYAKREYKGHRIPRIVVVSLSTPKPEPAQTESKPSSLNPHWRGTTTTVRSLLDPFVGLAPAGDRGDESTGIIEQLFVHLRTAKCFSDVGGTNQEPGQLYENCGEYLKKEVSILEPDVVVTQGGPAHWQAGKHVFGENAANTAVEEVEGIAKSIARIVHLRENDWKVYWLRSSFPTGLTNFYSADHAGKKVDSERGANRENLVRYGRAIKEFMDEEGR